MATWDTLRVIAAASAAGTTSGGLAGPQSVAWKINREIVLLAGWGRAVLMQFAHPLVAAGIADHSVFIGSPKLRRQRLVQTVNAMLALTFGSGAQVERAARGINAIHDRVQGRLGETTGVHAEGTRYSAHDPELVRWVHATLMDSFPLTHRLFVGPLSDDEVERYYQEAAGLEPLLGIPDGFLPRSRASVRDYMDSMAATGQLEVGPTARRLAHELLHPHVPILLYPIIGPLLWIARLPATGTLPPEIRAAYGFRWTRGHALALNAVSWLSRWIVPRLPGVVRHWAMARAAATRAERS